MNPVWFLIASVGFSILDIPKTHWYKTWETHSGNIHYYHPRKEGFLFPVCDGISGCFHCVFLKFCISVFWSITNLENPTHAITTNAGKATNLSFDNGVKIYVVSPIPCAGTLAEAPSAHGTSVPLLTSGVSRGESQVEILLNSTSTQFQLVFIGTWLNRIIMKR